MAGMLMRRSLQRFAPSLRAVVRIPYFLGIPCFATCKRLPHCGMLWVVPCNRAHDARCYMRRTDAEALTFCSSTGRQQHQVLRSPGVFRARRGMHSVCGSPLH